MVHKKFFLFAKEKKILSTNFQDIHNFQDYIMDKILGLNLNLDDVILTKNEQENLKFWNIRESIPLAEKKEKFVIKHDVSIPLENIDKFINETDKPRLAPFKLYFYV